MKNRNKLKNPVQVISGSVSTGSSGSQEPVNISKGYKEPLNNLHEFSKNNMHFLLIKNMPQFLLVFLDNFKGHFMILKISNFAQALADFRSDFKRSPG